MKGMGDSGTGRSQNSHLVIVNVDAVGKPDVVADPTPLVEHLDRSSAETFKTVGLFLDRLAQVRMQAQAVTSRLLCGLDHQVGGYREGTAGSHHNVDHLAVVVA